MVVIILSLCRRAHVLICEGCSPGPIKIICCAKFFYRAMLCIARTMLSQDVSLSVRPSVTRRYSVETAKHILDYFHHRVATLPHAPLQLYGTISPYLFAVYTDSVYHKAAATRVGCYIKGVCLNILMYADYIIGLGYYWHPLYQHSSIC